MCKFVNLVYFFFFLFECNGVFFFNDTATTEIYTLSLHDALPIDYVSLVAFLLVLCWLAGAAQLTALVAGRYAPYPSAAERPPRGPIRNSIRAIVLTARSR